MTTSKTKVYEVMATEHVLIHKMKYEQLAKSSNRMDDASVQTEQHFPDERSTDAYQQQQHTNDFPVSDDDFNSDASSKDNPDYDSYDVLQGFQPTEFNPFDTFGSAALPISTHLNYHWE